MLDKHQLLVLCAATYSTDPMAFGADMKVTKCVTIHAFESQSETESIPSTKEKWVNCFSLTPSSQQALNTKSDLESASLSHMLLRINVANQQPYHLPMVITPAFCVYLVTFDLRYQKASLSKIHSVMKDVYTLTTYHSEGEAKGADPPKVLLVGMHADEIKAEDRSSFAEKLNSRLEKMPYNRLVERPGGDEPFWAVDGGNLSLGGTDALSQQVQSYRSRHKVEVHQWIMHHCELEEKLQGKLQDAPCMFYSVLKDEVGSISSDARSNFDAILHFLHDYGFIFYHSVKVEEATDKEKEGQESDKVVVLRPQFLCELFDKVQEFSKNKERFTVADLMSRTSAQTEATAEHRQWFQRICIDMGLVVAVKADYVFLMALKGGPPSCPPPEEYSVPPLLMTFRDSNHFIVEPEYLLPSYFFAVFVTQFLSDLTQPNSIPPKVTVMEQHYMQVMKQTTSIHIVERDFCIEIGLQQLDVGKLPDEKKVKNLHATCRDVKSAVVKSAENIAKRLKLATPSIRYGFYHQCETEGGLLDSFGEFFNQDTDDGGPYLQCNCCDGGVHPTTPLQEIWFLPLEYFSSGEVCAVIQTVNGRECCNDMTEHAVRRSSVPSANASFQYSQVCIQTEVPPNGRKTIRKLQVVPQSEPACTVGHNCELLHLFHMRMESYI